jgi:hypothetical protein
MKSEETECEDVEWIHESKDRDKWRALVNTVPQKVTISFSRSSLLRGVV